MKKWFTEVKLWENKAAKYRFEPVLPYPVVKKPPVIVGMQETSSIPGLGRSPREGNGNPLQYSCLENSMDRETWWATVHGVAKSQTQLNAYASVLFYPGWDQALSAGTMFGNLKLFFYNLHITMMSDVTIKEYVILMFSCSLSLLVQFIQKPHWFFFCNLFLTVLGLHGCAWTFSSCGDRRLLSSCNVLASLVTEQRL